MLLKKFLLTGMAVLLSVSFILTGCQPEADDDDVVPPPGGNIVVIEDVSTDPITVKAGDNVLRVTASGGSLAEESKLKVYVKDTDFNEAVITTADELEGYTEAPDGYEVEKDGLEITVTYLEAATAEGADGEPGVLRAGEKAVTVTLAADAQTAPVRSIEAVSAVLAFKNVSTASAIPVKAGDDALGVTAVGGSLAEESKLKVYVKDGTYNEAVITTAETADELDGYTKATDGYEVVVDGLEITVTGLAAATDEGAAGVLKAGDVTVILAVDAQIEQVESITAASSSSDDTPVTAADLGSISPYTDAPNGEAVSQKNLTISPVTGIASGTIAAVRYTDVNNYGDFDAGDTQAFTITLVAVSGYTFANTGIEADDVAEAVLAATAFPAAALSAQITGTPGATLVVTVTYTKPGDRVITAVNLNAATSGIDKYAVLPKGTPFTGGSVTLKQAIASVAITAAAGSVDQGSDATVFDAGDTQEFTITLTAAAGRTFANTDIVAANIAVAILDSGVFGLAANGAEITGIPGATLVVTVTYTVPAGEVKPTYTVTYNANGGTGNPPDSGVYENGAEFTVPGNTGGLAKTGHIFAGWTVGSDGATVYGPDTEENKTYTIDGANVVFAAKWMAAGYVSVTIGFGYGDLLTVTTENGDPISPWTDSKGNVRLGVVSGTVTFTVTPANGAEYDRYEWSLDGAIDSEETDSTYELTTAGLDARDHNLTVKVTKDGQSFYSETVTFTVEENEEVNNEE